MEMSGPSFEDRASIGRIGLNDESWLIGAHIERL